MKFLLDEKGSMIPLWAIGGCMVFLSIFWVDNTSWTLLEKIRQMSHADTLTRIAMIEEGASDRNSEKILSAVSAPDNTAYYKFDSNLEQPNLETIDGRVYDGLLMSPFSNMATSSKTVAVPFVDVNKSIDVSEKVKFKSTDRALKLFKPINVIIAVENTQENRENFYQARQPLINAIRRLYQQAPASRVSLIPYSFRVNYLGRCYTGIERGDEFDFPWWEIYLDRVDASNLKEDALLAALAALEGAENKIKENNESVEKLKESLKDHDPGTADYQKIKNDIEKLVTLIKNIEETIPQLEKNLQEAEEESNQQKDIMESLEDHKLYDKYRFLAMHYAKKFDNYKLLEDYKDDFANSGIYKIDESNFLNSAARINVIEPYYLRRLAVWRNGPFSDSDTCPSVGVAGEMNNIGTVSSALSNLNFSNDKLMSLEGILWAGRQATSKTASGSRNVILLFTSDKEDVLDDNRLLGVSESCRAIKQSYINHRSSKIIFVVKNREAMDKFSKLNCATEIGGKSGFIVQDEIYDNFSEQMELNFMYLFSQESTTRDAN